MKENMFLEQQEEKFGITDPVDPINYDARLSRLIKTAHEQTGEKVVILIDEYDAPMLDSITTGICKTISATSCATCSRR